MVASCQRHTVPLSALMRGTAIIVAIKACIILIAGYMKGLITNAVRTAFNGKPKIPS